MNVKKYLKKESQKDLLALETEGDRAFLAQLKESVTEPPKPKRNKRWLWAIPSVAACAVAVVLIVEFVPFPSAVRYEKANFMQTDSSMTELSEVLTDITVCTNPEQTVKIQKTYDSVSGDDLFYTLIINEESDRVLFYTEARIVVNKNYEFDEFNITDEFVTETYSNYSVSYKPIITEDSNTGLNLVQCNGKIESKNYDIYIMSYEEYSIENGTFLTVIDSLFDFE